MAVTFLYVAVMYGLLLGLVSIYALAVLDLCQYADENGIPTLLLKPLGILFVAGALLLAELWEIHEDGFIITYEVVLACLSVHLRIIRVVAPSS